MRRPNLTIRIRDEVRAALAAAAADNQRSLSEEVEGRLELSITGRAPTNRGGRPRVEPRDGERIQLGFRVTADLKRSLELASALGGRSQSQEAELRLERSFRDGSLLIGIRGLIREEVRAAVEPLQAAIRYAAELKAGLRVHVDPVDIRPELISGPATYDDPLGR